mgnify:CR=1 FL=1
MLKVKVFNIKWDTDGEDVDDLPTVMSITIEDDDENDEQVAEQLISDAISDEVGFCHFGFEYNVIKSD